MLKRIKLPPIGPFTLKCARTELLSSESDFTDRYSRRHWQWEWFEGSTNDVIWLSAYFYFQKTDQIHRKRFTFQGKEIPLTISYGHRASHHATAQLTKILIEEGLGYDNVQLVPCFHDYGDVTSNCGDDR